MTQLLAILTAFAAVIGIGYVIWRPHWAVVVILVMFPLEQLLQGYFPFLAANGKIVNGGVGVLALFAICTRFFRGEQPFSGVMNPATIGAMALWVLSWAGLLWTPGERAFEMLNFGIPYVLLLLIATQMLLDDVVDFHRVAVGVMFLGSIIAVLVMLNPATSLAGGRLTVEIGLYSGDRTSNPLALATMGGLMAVLAALVQFDRPRTFHLILRLAAFGLGLGLAISSGSRGQVVAAVIVGVAFYPLARQVASLGQFFMSALGYGVLFLALYVVFNIFIGDWNRDRWDVASAMDVTSGRYAHVRDFLNAFLAEPSMWMFGLGPMAFQSATGASVDYVHNQPVEVLCELGFVGFFFYVIVAATVVRGGLWLWRVYGDDPLKRGAAATLCGLAAYSFIVSLKQGSITNSGPTALSWWLVLACIAAHERRLHAAAVLEWARSGGEGSEEEDYLGDESYGDYGDYGEGYDEDGGEYAVSS